MAMNRQASKLRCPGWSRGGPSGGRSTGWCCHAPTHAVGCTTAGSLPRSAILIAASTSPSVALKLNLSITALAGRRFVFAMDYHEDSDAPGYYICEIKTRAPLCGRKGDRRGRVRPSDLGCFPNSMGANPLRGVASGAHLRRGPCWHAADSGRWNFTSSATTRRIRFVAKRLWRFRWRRGSAPATHRPGDGTCARAA